MWKLKKKKLVITLDGKLLDLDMKLSDQGVKGDSVICACLSKVALNKQPSSSPFIRAFGTQLPGSLNSETRELFENWPELPPRPQPTYR